jgi:hypothetical protein
MHRMEALDSASLCLMVVWSVADGPWHEAAIVGLKWLRHVATRSWRRRHMDSVRQWSSSIRRPRNLRPTGYNGYLVVRGCPTPINMWWPAWGSLSLLAISLACTPFEIERLPSTHLITSLHHSCEIEWDSSAFALELHLAALDLCDCFGFLVTLGWFLSP